MYVNFHNSSADIERAIYEDDNSECPICLEKISNSKYTILKCNHVFHKNCANSWLKKQVTCPMCRTYLKPYYQGSVYNNNKFKIGTKFNLILNDEHLIIKYYYKYTTILKKRVIMPFTKIKYFSYSKEYFTYEFYDESSKNLKKEILKMNHPSMAEIIFRLLKTQVNQMAKTHKKHIYENSDI